MNPDLPERRPRRASRPRLAGLISMLTALVFSSGVSPAEEPASAADLGKQAVQYKAEVAKTIVELQQFRQSESSVAKGADGRKGRATLTNLNPAINAWFLLQLDWENGRRAAYHLENPDPKGQSLHLSDAEPRGIQIVSAEKSTDCDLWSGLDASAVQAAQRTDSPYEIGRAHV